MGFASGDGKLAWVHLHPPTSSAGRRRPGGVVLCDEQGKVTTLDATTGGVAAEADVGEPLQGVRRQRRRAARLQARPPR